MTESHDEPSVLRLLEDFKDLRPSQFAELLALLEEHYDDLEAYLPEGSLVEKAAEIIQIFDQPPRSLKVLRRALNTVMVKHAVLKTVSIPPHVVPTTSPRQTTHNNRSPRKTNASKPKTKTSFLTIAMIVLAMAGIASFAVLLSLFTQASVCANNMDPYYTNQPTAPSSHDSTTPTKPRRTHDRTPPTSDGPSM